MPNGKAVYWGDVEKPKLKKTKPVQLSGSIDDSKKLKNDIKALQQKITNFESNQSILHQFLYKHRNSL